jgi:hypothetical protein
MFAPRYIAVQGRDHRKHNQPCQDAALGMSSDEYAIVAVCDGVGDPTGTSEPSSTQVGAGLTVRAAVHAVDQHMREGRSRAHVGRVIREALAPLLRTVSSAMARQEALLSLPATLVLAVLQDNGVDVWAAGDGEAFVAVSASSGVELVRGSEHVRPIEGGYLWQKLGRHVGAIPYDAVEEPADDIPQRVLTVEGPVLGVYVATDGFSEATEARTMLQQVPNALYSNIKTALLRSQLEVDPGRAPRQLEVAGAEVGRGEPEYAASRLRSLVSQGLTRDDAAVAWANRVFRSNRTPSESLPRGRWTLKDDELAHRIAELYIEQGYDPKRALSIGYATIEQRGRLVRP